MNTEPKPDTPHVLPPAYRTVAVQQPLTPMDMLHKAVSSGADMALIEKLMSLQERWEATQARKAFDNAIAAARGEIPPITKNRKVDYTSQKGRTNYIYEDMAEIARTVDPILAKHGLSYRFRTASEINHPISVTCIVSHRDGHSEENTLSAPRDETGNKNAVQSLGSSLTYLQRYCLKAALGLAASNDDDGRGGKDDDGALITAEQVRELDGLLDSTKSNKALFLKLIKLENLADIRSDKFDDAKKMIEENARKRKEQDERLQHLPKGRV